LISIEPSIFQNIKRTEKLADVTDVADVADAADAADAPTLPMAPPIQTRMTIATHCHTFPNQNSENHLRPFPKVH